MPLIVFGECLAYNRFIYMHIGLFIPCYIDQFYPQVGLATVDLFERTACRWSIPRSKPAAASRWPTPACTATRARSPNDSSQIFAPYDYVVSPSGSCVAMVRHHYDQVLGHSPQLEAVAHKTFELANSSSTSSRSIGCPARFRTASVCIKAATGCVNYGSASGSELVGPSFNKATTIA